MLSLRSGLILAILTLVAAATHGQDRPRWRFSVMASIDTAFVTQFGGLENCDRLIRHQLDSVNHIYNDPGVFDGELEFYLDSLQPFSQSGITQAHEPHPHQDYHVVYDFDHRTLFSWLYPPDNAVIYQTPSTSEVPFPFIEIGNLVLAHELAHSRGAVDLYALEVDESFNRVVDMSFEVPGSIMSDLVSRVWSDHTILTINKNGGDVLSRAEFGLTTFPSGMIIRVVDSLQRPVPGADVRVYGHTWYNMALSDLELDEGTTNLRGEYWLSEDLFIGPDNAEACLKPLCLQYSTLLLEIETDQCVEYVWLPFTEPQTHELSMNPDAFVKTVELPLIHSGAGGGSLLPDKFRLHQNFPNPFNARTSICVTLASEAHLRLEITNVLGQAQTVLHDAPLRDGTTCFEWDGPASSGVYFCRATYGGVSQTVKMLLLK